MKRCRAEVDFILGDTGEMIKAGRVIDLSDDVINRAKKINSNMLTVLGDVTPKKKTTKSKN